MRNIFIGYMLGQRQPVALRRNHDLDASAHNHGPDYAI
jgi:hypothetical protein